MIHIDTCTKCIFWSFKTRVNQNLTTITMCQVITVCLLMNVAIYIVQIQKANKNYTVYDMHSLVIRGFMGELPKSTLGNRPSTMFY